MKSKMITVIFYYFVETFKTMATQNSLRMKSNKLIANKRV